MKENFIKLLLIMGFYQLPSNNLAKANEYHYDQFRVYIGKKGWILYFNGKGIGDKESFYVKDLFKLMMDHCSQVRDN